jgi:hypothetical protein
MKKVHSIITLESKEQDLSVIKEYFSGVLCKHRQPNVANKRGVLGEDWCFSFEYNGINEADCLLVALNDYERARTLLAKFRSEIKVTILLVIYFTDHCSLGFDKETLKRLTQHNIQFNVDAYKVSKKDLKSESR